MNATLRNGFMRLGALALVLAVATTGAHAATFAGGGATDLQVVPMPNGVVELSWKAASTGGGGITYDVYRVTATTPPPSFDSDDLIATGLSNAGVLITFQNTPSQPPLNPTDDGSPYWYGVRANEPGETPVFSSTVPATADENDPVAVDDLVADGVDKAALVNLNFTNPFDTVDESEQQAIPSSAYLFDYLIFAKKQNTDLLQADVIPANLIQSVTVFNYIIGQATEAVFIGDGGTEYAFATIVQDTVGNRSTISTGSGVYDTREITAITTIAAVSSASGSNSITELTWDANEASMGPDYEFRIYGKIASSTADGITAGDIVGGTAVLLDVQRRDNSNTFIHTGTTPGLPRVGGLLYAYNVISVDLTPTNIPEIVSPLSVDAFALASDGVPPPCPANVVASATVGGDIVVNWTDLGDNPGGSGVASFNIYRGVGGPAVLSPTPYANVPLTNPLGVNTFTDTMTLDGVFYCYLVTAVDVDGNESTDACNQDCATSDASPPTIVAISAVPPIAGLGSTVIISVTASEVLAGAPEVTVNTSNTDQVPATSNGDPGPVYTYTYNTLNTETEGAGNAIISVTGTDMASNEAYLTSNTALQFDFTAPVVTNIRRTSGDFYQNAPDPGATYAYDSDEMLSSADLLLNGATATFISAVSPSYNFGYSTTGTEPQGNVTGTAIAADLAVPPNVATIASATPVAFFDFVDPNAPSALAGVVGASGTVDLTWTDNGDAGVPAEQSGVDYFNIYRTPAGAGAYILVATSAMTMYTDAADGDFEYEVTAVDRAGNESARSNTAGPFTLDSAGPTFVITATPMVAGLNSSVTLTLVASEAVSGTPVVTLGTPDSGENAASLLPGATTDTFQFLYMTMNIETEGPGVVSVTATATDLVGNMATTVVTDATGNFLQFDFTAPVLSNLVVNAPRPWVTSTDPVSVSFNSTELLDVSADPMTIGGVAGTLASETVNGPTDVDYLFDFNVAGAAMDGTNTVLAQGQDFAVPANLSNSITDTLFIDRVDPNSPSGVTASPGPGGVIDLTWTDNGDAGPIAEQSGVDFFNIYRSVLPSTAVVQIATSPTTAYTDPFTLSGNSYFYVVTAVDRATNESFLAPTPINSATSVSDATPPVLLIVDATPDVAGLASSVTITVSANEALIAPPTVTVNTAGSGTNAASFLSQAGNDYFYSYSTIGTETEGPNEVTISAAGADIAGNTATVSRLDNNGDLLVFDFTPPSILALTVDPIYMAGVLGTAVMDGATVSINLLTDEDINPANSTITVDGSAATFVSSTMVGAATYSIDYLYFANAGTDNEGPVEVSTQVADNALQTANLSAVVTDTVFLDFTDPNAPSPVVASLLPMGVVDITWTDQGDAGVPAEQSGVGAFNIYREVVATPGFVQIGQVLAPTATFLDTFALTGVEYRYAVSAVDVALNESPISATNTSNPVIPDASAPELISLTAVPNPAGFPTSVTITLVANEALATTPTLSVITAGSGVVPATAIAGTTDTFVFLYNVLGTETEGAGNANTVAALIDNASNAGVVSASDTPFFDFTGPVVSNFQITSPTLCIGASETVTFSFDTDEPLSAATVVLAGVTATVDLGTLAGPTVTGSVFIDSTATEGQAVAVITASDTATPANISSVTELTNLFIDRTDPVTNTFTSPLANDVVGGTINVAAAVADNPGGGGIVLTEFLFDGNPIGSDTDPTAPSILWDTTGSPDGPGVLTSITQDCAGNSLSATIPILLDNNPPDLVEIYSLNGPIVPGVTPCVGGMAVICATASDAGSGIDEVEFYFLPDSATTEVSLGVDGTDSAPGVAGSYCLMFDSTTLPDGPGTFRAVARDQAAQEAEDTQRGIVDNSPPSVRALAEAIPRGVRSLSNGGTPANLQTAASDSVSFIREITIDLTPIGGSAGVAMANVGGDLYSVISGATTTTEGLYNLPVSATDCAGNSASGIITLIVDNSPPIADADGLDARYPAWSVLGQNGFPSGSNNWQFELPGTWNDNELRDPTSWDSEPGAAILGGIADVLNRAVDNRPLANPSGIGRVDLYYQASARDIVPASRPLSSWTYIGSATAYTDMVVDLTIEFDTAGLVPSNTTSGQNFYFLKTVTSDIAGNTLDPIFGPFAIVDTAAPGPITWLRARSQQGTSDVLLDWALGGPAPDNGTLDYYEIYRDREPIFSVAGLPVYATEPAIAPNGQDTLTYLDSVPDIGTYWYAILAVDTAGNRDPNNFSNTVAAAKLDIDPPNAVTDLMASPGADDSNIALTWTAPIDNVGVVYYNIYRKEQGAPLADSDPNDKVGDMVPTNKIAEVTADLRPTTVDDERASLVSAASNTIAVDCAPLDATSVLTIRNVTTNVYYGVADVSGTLITLSTGPGAPALPVVGDDVRVDYITNKERWIDDQVVPGVTYAYAVQAVDANGNKATISTGLSTGSTDLELDTVARAIDTTMPAAIDNLVAEDIDSTTDILLEWFTTPLDDVGVASYKIYRSTTPITDLADPNVHLVYGYAPQYEVPASATQTFVLDATGFVPSSFRALDLTRWIEFGTAGTNAPILGGATVTLQDIPTTPLMGGILDNVKFVYAPMNLYSAGTDSYAEQTQFVDSFADPFAPAEVENVTFYYAVTAVDLLGNESLISNTEGATVNDITPPPIPDANLIVVEQNAPGQEDYVYGTAGAVEPLSEVRVYANLPVFGLVLVTTNNPVFANLDGSFPRISLGDNVVPELFVVSRDAAGNTSPMAGPFTNDIVAPPKPLIVNVLGEVGRVNENPPGTQDVAMGTVDTTGEPAGSVTVRAYREASLNAVINEATTANAFALPIGDNLVDVVYVTAIDDAGNESPPAIGLNDIVPPEPAFDVIVNSNPPGTDDTVEGAVDGDVVQVCIYTSATLSMGSLIDCVTPTGRAFGPVSIGDNGNGVGIDRVWVVTVDRAGNISTPVLRLNDITSPIVYDVDIDQRFPGFDDLLDVQTEPNSLLSIWSTQMNVTEDSIEVLADGFQRPGGLGIDVGGSNVLVTDQAADTLTQLVLDANGNVTGTNVLASGLTNPTGVAAAPNGVRYIGHATGNLQGARIARLLTNGTLQVNWMSPVNFGPNAVGPEVVGPVFDSPTSFVFTSTDSVSVFRVDLTQPTPMMQKVIGAANRFDEPHAIAVDPSGNIYVADWRDGSDVITKTTPSGDFSIVATGLNEPTALAVDQTGTLYVLQSVTGSTEKAFTLVRPSGQKRDLYRAEWPGEGVGLVFDDRDGEGNILWTSSEASQIFQAPLGTSGYNPLFPQNETLVRGRPADAYVFGDSIQVDGAGRLLDFSVGDNLVRRVSVVARDAAGNWSAPVEVENDSTPPAIPFVQLSSNWPGNNDTVHGQTEPGATVRVYGDAGLTNLVASTVADRRTGAFSGLFIGDNLYAMVWVTAEDQWGNESMSVALENDISTIDPRAENIIVVENKPGEEDEVFGLFNAVEANATVHIYANEQLTRLLGSGPADEFGGFAAIEVGDNEAGELFLQATDHAGNKSGVLNLFNDITPPATPVSLNIVVTNNPPGTPDYVEGLKDTVERNDETVLLYAFSNANQTGLIQGWPVPVNNDGSFGVPGLGVSVGDNYWDPVGLRTIGPVGQDNLIYLVTEDQAGNRGPAVAVEVDARITILNDVNKFVVTANPPGVQDLLAGLPGAAEAESQVRLYRFAPPTGVLTSNGLLNTTFASLDGTFGPVPAGDDVDPIFVQLVDDAGNVSNTIAVPNDTVPPAVPNANAIAVLMNPPGSDDYLLGRPGAVDPVGDPDVHSVRVYAGANRTQFLGELPINADGSFPRLAIGDNQYAQVYVTALDRNRNESAPSAPIHNDIFLPETPSIMVVENAPGIEDFASGTVPSMTGPTTVTVPLVRGGAAPVNTPGITMGVASNRTQVDLQVETLTPLENGFSYEGWVVGNLVNETQMAFISTGKFNVESNGNLILLDQAGQNPVFVGDDNFTFSQQGAVLQSETGFVSVDPASLPVDLLTGDALFVLSIEPAGDNDFVPGDTKFLSSPVVPGLATELAFPNENWLMVATGQAAFDVNASGQNDGTVTYNFQNLPPLYFGGQPAALDYEGWVVGPGGPISTGKFDINDAGEIVNTDGTPRSNTFTAQGGVDLTTQNAVVITIEPSPDDAPGPNMPFAFRPLSGQINIPMSGDAVSVALYGDAALDDVIILGTVSNGLWGPLSIGDNEYGTVYARTFDAAGNASDVSIGRNDITPPERPLVAVTQNAPGTDDQVAGYAEANATITVYANESQTIVAATGVATAGTVVQAIGGGDISIGDNLYSDVWVTATDAAGNEGLATHITNDIEAPAAPDRGNVVLSESGTPFQDSLTGLAGAFDVDEEFLWAVVYSETPFTAANEMVRVAVNDVGGFGTQLIGDNYWNPDTQMPVGEELVYLLGIDTAGNVGGAIALELDVRTQTPDRNRITVHSNPPGTPDMVEAREGAVEADSTVRFYSETGEVGLLAVATASDDGGWKPVPVSDNVDPIYIVATDPAGNKSGEIAVRNDVDLPARPNINNIVVISNPPGTDDLVLGRSGAVSDGVLVRIFEFANATGLIGQSLVAPDGSFPAISIGDNRYGRVYAAAVDANGNQSDTVELINDIDASDLPTVVVNSNPPGYQDEVSGSVAADVAEVRVYADANLSQFIISGPRIGGGYGWLPIGDNQYDKIWVTTVDEAGNESGAVMATNDIVAPGAPVAFIQANQPGTDDVLNGFAEPNSTLTVYDPNGVVIAELTVTPQGTFSTPIGDNLYNWVGIYATDAAGNRSVLVQVLNDLDPPAPVNLSAVSLLNNPAGNEDAITSRPGAVTEDTAIVRIYSDPFLENEVAQALVPGGKTFFIYTNIGDDLYNRLYLVAEDAAGNQSAPVEILVGLRFALLDGYGGVFFGNTEPLFAGPQFAKPWANDLEFTNGTEWSFFVLGENGQVYGFGDGPTLPAQVDSKGFFARDLELVWTPAAPFAASAYVMTSTEILFINGAPDFGQDVGNLNDTNRDMEVVFNAPGDVAGYYVLRDSGQISAFGSVPAMAGEDLILPVARDLLVLGDGDGYILDGAGVVYPLGDAPEFVTPFFGYDIAKKIVLTHTGDIEDGLYMLDGFGGIHALGEAKPLVGAPYFGFDIARDLEILKDRR